MLSQHWVFFWHILYMDIYGLLWLFPNIFVVWILFERDSTGEEKQVRKFFAHPSFPPPPSIRRWLKWSKEGKKKKKTLSLPLFFSAGRASVGMEEVGAKWNSKVQSSMHFCQKTTEAKKKNWKNKNWQFSRESAVRSRPPIMRLKGVF